ncbi:hypothetical protein AB0O68_34865 [Streptomyces sp. NPDC087512]|uniref:hypothetical protein n=1 Tax=Streptomyces sp. NPDC087512 TaxID=3155059 RepID=UPI0034208FC7
MAVPENVGVSYEDCSVYVDAGDGSTVITWLKERLGAGDGGQNLTVGPLQVSGVHNDYPTGRKAHPFEFLEWLTVLECEAPAEAEPGAVVAAVTLVLETLWSGGWKAVAACGFEDELPARGGSERYPLPSSSEALTQARTGRWKGLLVQGGKRKRNSV